MVNIQTQHVSAASCKLVPLGLATFWIEFSQVPQLSVGQGDKVIIAEAESIYTSVFYSLYSILERRGTPVVRTLAYHAGGPGSIPRLAGENY